MTNKYIWQRAYLIARELGCTPLRAKQIANQVLEDWKRGLV